MSFKSNVLCRLHKRHIYFISVQSETNSSSGDAVAWPYCANAPAGELDELCFISALQQGLSVLQQDSRADEEFKGEVRVDGLQFWLWAVLCKDRQRLFPLTFNRNKKSCSFAR